MKTGTATFTAKTQDLIIEEFETDSEHKNINRFSCSVSDNGILKLVVHLEDVFSSGWPCRSIIEEVIQFVSALSFKFSIPFHSLSLSGYSIKKSELSDRYDVHASHISLCSIMKEAITPGAKSIEDFIDLYKALRHSPWVSIYASAIRQEDPVAKFMFLYNIILSISGDKQKELDRRILSVAPDTNRTRSPKDPKIFETVFTRLRNEVGHSRKLEDIDGIRSEIIDNLPVFESHVKSLLKAEILLAS